MSDAPVELQGSPDSPEPVTPDLVSTMTEEELLELAVELIQARSPEWTPRAGAQEVILLEAFVMLLTSLNFTVTQMPSRVVEHLMRLYGVVRDEGAPTRAMVRFEVTGSRSLYTVPAGTRVRARFEELGETVDLVTVGSLEVESSVGYGDVEAVAEENGDEFNGLPEGRSLDLVDGALVFVERVSLATPTAGGRGEELDASFQSRAAALLDRQVSTLVLPRNFEAAALERPEVFRARVLDLYDPTASGGEPPGSHVGHVTVAVADKDGAQLSEGQMLELRWALEQQALASLIIHVIPPTYTTVNLSVTVRPSAERYAEGLEEAVEEALRSWLSPARWDWGGAVTQYGVVARVAGVEGVGEIVSVSPTVDLNGVAPLPLAGDISVTVEELL